MEPRPPPLRLAAVPPAGPAAVPEPGGRDVGLLSFLLAVHAVPLVALAAGHPWGARVVGYATAVTLAASRELIRELRAGGRARHGRAP